MPKLGATPANEATPRFAYTVNPDGSLRAHKLDLARYTDELKDAQRAQAESAWSDRAA
jgi:hypothetical protein